MPEIDEQSLFDAATSDEPEAISEELSQVDMLVEAKAEVEAKEQQARDEAGRFAKAETEKPAADAEKPAIDDNAPQVPSWRVREINDEKRALAEKVAALEAERQNWQRQQVQEKPAPKPEVTKPDPLLDPDGYERYLEAKFEEKLLNNQRTASLAQAHRTYKQEFEEASEAAMKQFYPELRAQMQQSQDPGETLIKWHREMKTRAEVGSDLNAYKEKLRKEALEDPEFRKAAMEAWREQAPSNGRSRVDLPPSLNGASRSNALLRSADGDVSDAELFHQITG